STLSLFIILRSRYVNCHLVRNIHWTHDLLDERDFFVGESILLVEDLVRPCPCPVLNGHERVNLAGHMLGRLPKLDQQAGQSARQIGQCSLCLLSRVEWTNAEIRL